MPIYNHVGPCFLIGSGLTFIGHCHLHYTLCTMYLSLGGCVIILIIGQVANLYTNKNKETQQDFYYLLEYTIYTLLIEFSFIMWLSYACQWPMFRTLTKITETWRNCVSGATPSVWHKVPNMLTFIRHYTVCTNWIPYKGYIRYPYCAWWLLASTPPLSTSQHTHSVFNSRACKPFPHSIFNPQGDPTAITELPGRSGRTGELRTPTNIPPLCFPPRSLSHPVTLRSLYIALTTQILLTSLLLDAL